MIGKEFDAEPVYGNNYKYMKTRTNVFEDNINTNFHSKEIPKENVSYECFSVILLDSIIRANKKYYPQTLLEEFEHVVKKTKADNLINGVFRTSSLI